MRSLTGRAPFTWLLHFVWCLSIPVRTSTHNNTLTLTPGRSGGRHVVDNSAGVGITMSLCAGGLVDVDAVG
ncbi:hypothetical protein CI102_2164 [Trichoderma harzianum]|nr:hypothetical protein CI102_2164 [Trichoderma harzianum]